MRGKISSEKEKQKEMIITDWLLQETIENRPRKLYNPKPLQEIARDNIKLDDNQLNKELAKRIKNPYFFTDRALQVGFNITLDSHHINHVHSKTTLISNFPEFGNELRYKNIILREMADIYARLINQYKFKHQAVVSARFDKQDEDNQALDETELFINWNINRNLTETDIDNNDFKPPLEH